MDEFQIGVLVVMLVIAVVSGVVVWRTPRG